MRVCIATASLLSRVANATNARYSHEFRDCIAAKISRVNVRRSFEILLYYTSQLPVLDYLVSYFFTHFKRFVVEMERTFESFGNETHLKTLRKKRVIGCRILI